MNDEKMDDGKKDHAAAGTCEIGAYLMAATYKLRTMELWNYGTTMADGLCGDGNRYGDRHDG